MAILSRRGPNNNFDPEKLLPGEWAVVLSGDPNADDGMSVYICFSAGNVKRMATYEDMQENINAITEDIRNYLLQGVSVAISNAESATLSATNAAESASSAANEANSALSAIQSAVSGTVINDNQSSQYTVFSSEYVDDNYLKTDGDISECTAEFTGSSERENIETGESAATIFGKIKKFFTDLKTVAFTGLYSDLSGKPTLGNAAAKNVANNLITSSSGSSVLDAYQGKLLNDNKLNKASVLNNLTTTVSGYALDARQGKILDDKIKKLRAIMTIQLQADSKYASAEIPLTMLTTSSGESDELEHSGGRIKIGSGVSKVLVSGAMFAITANASEYLWGRIDVVKSSGQVEEQQTSIASTTLGFASVSLTPVLVNVSEGDEIRLFKINSDNDTLRANKNTWLTVQVIE